MVEKESQLELEAKRLISLLTAEDEPRVEQMEALIKLGSAAIPFLIQTLATSDSVWQVQRVGTTLMMFGEKAVIPLLEALNNPAYPRRSLIPFALSGIGDSRAVEPLLLALNDTTEIDLQREAAAALAFLRMKG
jgi:HEAT repeat protein